MPSPLVTVIIPTFNWSGVLPYSIGSALRQTFSDFELLVVGDGCTDDSEAVVASVGDERVRWINLTTNAGHQSGPNNEGLRQARGELVAYLGHDDLWLPHHLDCLVRALEHGADLAYGITAMVGPEGATMTPAPTPMRYKPGMWVPPTCVAHRRRVVEHVGGWRHAREVPIDPEADLWRRLHDAGHMIEPVARLTAIKFPAALRKGVYVERPHHEQAEWTERLRAETDLEPALLGRMLSDATDHTASAGGLLRAFSDEAAHRVRDHVLRRAPGLYLFAKNEQRKRQRNFKGLEPQP
jgi:hypothetical protein